MYGLKDLVERTGFVLVAGLLVTLGFLQGFQVYSFTLDLFFVVVDVFWVEAVFSSLGFAAFILFSSLIYFGRVVLWSPCGGSAEGSVTCVVPTYRDSDVLHRSVESLLDSGYRDFEVVIVCEEDDEEGIEEAERLSRRDEVSFLVNSYADNKAGAMNYAAAETDSDYIAFFDSDQCVREDFLGKAVAELQDHEVVQGRNVPRPDGLIESLSYYESVFFTYVSRQFLTLLTDFRLVGSRSVVMERKVFEEMDGYSDDTLVEDYDFAHRCYLEGVDIADVPLPVENLAAHSLRDWWGQRKRWMTGYFQVLSKSVKNFFRDFKGYRSAISVLISAGSIIGSFFILTLVSKFVILLFLGAELIYMMPIAVLLLMALVFRLHDRRYNFPGSIGFSWLLVPLIFPFFSLITVRSFFEFLFDREMEWYRVEK
jgi:cellulose synthase/poly-beta-1,6-N-acetylglucosamine synthase-like glycosyltransferase